MTRQLRAQEEGYDRVACADLCLVRASCMVAKGYWSALLSNNRPAGAKARTDGQRDGCSKRLLWDG